MALVSPVIRNGPLKDWQNAKTPIGPHQIDGSL